MKRRNFLASLGLVAGVSAVAKADKKKESSLSISIEGEERMRIDSFGNIYHWNIPKKN